MADSSTSPLTASSVLMCRLATNASNILLSLSQYIFWLSNSHSSELLELISYCACAVNCLHLAPSKLSTCKLTVESFFYKPCLLLIPALCVPLLPCVKPLHTHGLSMHCTCSGSPHDVASHRTSKSFVVDLLLVRKVCLFLHPCTAK